MIWQRVCNCKPGNLVPESSPNPTSLRRELLGMLQFRAVRLAGLVFLIVGVGTECFITKLSVLDLDIWWHLSAGDWMIRTMLPAHWHFVTHGC